MVSFWSELGGYALLLLVLAALYVAQERVVKPLGRRILGGEQPAAPAPAPTSELAA